MSDEPQPSVTPVDEDLDPIVVMCRNAFKDMMGERVAVINADTGAVLYVGPSTEIKFKGSQIIFPTITLYKVEEEQ